MNLPGWERIAPPIAVLCASVLVGWLAFYGLHLPGDDCGFCPLEIKPLIVEPNPVVIGGPARVRGSVCNKTNEAVPATITVNLESPVSPLGSTGTVMELTSTTRVLDPNTCYPDPDITEIESVPSYVPIGTWRVSVLAVARGPEGEMQREVGTSEFFEVVSEGGP